MPTDHFLVYRQKRTPSRVVLPRRWRWKLIAANGEQVAQGQSYRDKTDAVRACEDVSDILADLIPVQVEE